MKLLTAALHATLITVSFILPVFADAVDERNWQHWDNDAISSQIHSYWLASEKEMLHRQALAQLVSAYYLPHECFLEAGCGSGLVYCQLVPSIINNTDYVGIDISDKMLAIAKLYNPLGQFYHDDLYQISLSDNSVEIAAAFEVFGHIPDIVIPIRELFRVANRLVMFTVWTGKMTRITHEHFLDADFLHITYSHDDIMKAIHDAIGDRYVVETIPIQDKIAAYIIKKSL